MSYVDLEREELMTLLDAEGKRFTALLRELAPGDETKPCHGLIWNVGDVATHVLTVVRRSLSDRRRSGTPAELAELNALSIQELGANDPQAIADLIDADMNIMLNRIYPRIGDDRRFPFHAGATISVRPALAITLGEFMMHGNDIARACDKAWPINPHIAALAWRGILEPLAAWLKPGAADGISDSYLFRLIGEDGTLALQFTDNTVLLRPHWQGTADYEIVIDPVELVFVFPYGRRVAGDELLAQLVERFQPI
ncbi:MAG: maleylpyruvate isomerase N-terminal domain-containing protein [Anaerolineae bacterium]